MTFVTRLTLQSGDRDVLEDLVADLKGMLERKGVECKGPHSEPTRELDVPQYRTLSPGGTFGSWRYPVYTRTMEIHGADEVARDVGHREFPRSVHVEIEVERKRPLGYRRN